MTIGGIDPKKDRNRKVADYAHSVVPLKPEEGKKNHINNVCALLYKFFVVVENNV